MTGGGGFIGSHLVDALIANGIRVTVLDNFETGSRANLPEGIKVVEGDICDRSSVDTAMSGADIVFHLAAFNSVEASVKEPLQCFAVNDLGFIQVLESARRHGVERVVFSSSSAVYDGCAAGPKREEELPNPLSPYALTKMDGEQLLAILGQEYKISWLALRYFNVYGPRQRPQGEDGAVIPAFIERALGGADLVIYGDGTQTRDFIFVEDVVRANLEAARIGQGVYNIGIGRALSILELAHRTIKLAGSSSGIIFAPPRAGDVLHLQADISRANRELGWAPRWSLEDGLSRTISWFRTRRTYT